MGISPIPATTITLCQYASVLARSLKYSSIKQYMNIVRIIHLEWSLPNPMQDNYHLQCVMRGIRRSIGDAVSRKQPITPSLLLKMLSRLDLSLMSDAAIWSAMLVLFYGMLRMASLLCPSSRCDHARHILKSDISSTPNGVLVVVRATKTIQFGDRSLRVPLPRSQGNPLCPVQALTHYMKLAPTPNSPAEPPFMVGRDRPLTGPIFSNRIKSLLSELNINTASYAAHSYRRGGATLAYRLGVPVDTIRQLGDWASNSYTAYILPDLPLINACVERMVKGAQSVPY